MHNKKEANEASDKAVIASVVEEMAQPRMAKSARMTTDKQIHARDGKPVQCESPPKTRQSGMAREMIWVKRIEGWGCSYCAWAFIPSGPFLS